MAGRKLRSRSKATRERASAATATGAELSPKAALIPLALIVLLFPRQSLRMLTRATALLQAFTLGMGLKNQFQRMRLRPHPDSA